MLYHEVKRRLFEQAENSVARFKDLEKKHTEEIEKQNLESSQREARLVTDNDLLNEEIESKRQDQRAQQGPRRERQDH